MKREELLPRLDYFINHGVWTGSRAFPGKASVSEEMRYRALAQDDMLTVCVWHGPNCFQKAEILSEVQCELSEEGLDKAFLWLNEQYQKMI